MASPFFEVRGVSLFVAFLSRIASREVRLGAALAGAEYFIERVENPRLSYAPESQANWPPGVVNPRTGRPYGRWYVRGQGTYTLTGRYYPTSENMLESWEVDIVGEEAVRVSTGVSYAPWVIGEEQVEFHRRRGWLRFDQFVALHERGITDAMESFYREVLAEE